MKGLVTEEEFKEEWYQEEFICNECGVTFMYSSYPDFPFYPSFCPNCGIRFTGVQRGNKIQYFRETIF